MDSVNLLSVSEAASSLQISEDLVQKFIQMGLIATVKEGHSKKLTPYGMRRLMRAMDMYEKSYSTENIERLL
ncbi:MAG: hypothetical protein KDF60_05245 [Calditrichaeota bacterium]|nr:hypothetical protein [Calditrichota bacterium]